MVNWQIELSSNLLSLIISRTKLACSFSEGCKTGGNHESQGKNLNRTTGRKKLKSFRWIYCNSNLDQSVILIPLKYQNQWQSKNTKRSRLTEMPNSHKPSQIIDTGIKGWSNGHCWTRRASFINGTRNQRYTIARRTKNEAGLMHALIKVKLWLKIFF